MLLPPDHALESSFPLGGYWFCVFFSFFHSLGLMWFCGWKKTPFLGDVLCCTPLHRLFSPCRSVWSSLSFCSCGLPLPLRAKISQALLNQMNVFSRKQVHEFRLLSMLVFPKVSRDCAYLFVFSFVCLWDGVFLLVFVWDFFFFTKLFSLGLLNAWVYFSLGGQGSVVRMFKC